MMSSDESKGDDEKYYTELKSTLPLPLGRPQANFNKLLRNIDAEVENEKKLLELAEEKAYHEKYSGDMGAIEMGLNEAKETNEQVNPNVNNSAISRDAMNKLVAETLGGKTTRKAYKHRKSHKAKKGHKSRTSHKSKKARKTRK
jgi:hypothetical protein